MEGYIQIISRQVLINSYRTDNDIKNHFYSTLRRSLRRLNKILGQRNSTSQMREIKPSVLTTIMSFNYGNANKLKTESVEGGNGIKGTQFSK